MDLVELPNPSVEAHDMFNAMDEMTIMGLTLMEDMWDMKDIKITSYFARKE